MRAILLVVVCFFVSFVCAEETPNPQPAPSTPAPATESAKPEPATPVPAKQEPAKPATPATPTPMRSPMLRHPESSPADMLSRMFPGLGLDSKSVRWDVFPLGMEKRFLTSLQVGSIENPGAVDFPAMSGWPVEEILKLSADEAKAVQTLRQEYDAERKKLDEEVAEFHKAEAEKFRALRLKYEQKANEALSPEQREAKQKFDALREELISRKKALVTDTLGADFSAVKGGQGSTAIGKLREGLSKIVGELELKFLEIAPAEAKAKIEATIKQQVAMRERMYQMNNPPPRPMPTQPVQPLTAKQPPAVQQPAQPAQPSNPPVDQPPAPPPAKERDNQGSAEEKK
jgi:hypothetical protein